MNIIMNLLEVRLIHRLFLSRWFPLAVQLIVLMAFILIILGGLGVNTSDMKLAKVLRNTNLASLAVWSYWWPLVIISAVLLGRVWCMVCPMELVNAVSARVGLRKRVPRFFKSGWVITVFYAIILIVGMRTWRLNRVPHKMALYMLALLVIAVLVSLVYEKRAFCSYVCPVGYLLGLYALISPFEWRAGDVSVCQSCKTKECIAKKKHYEVIGRSCTSNLYPPRIRDNQDCLLCTQCLKVCPHDNLRLSTRNFFADFYQRISLRPAQAAFVLLLSGLVLYELYEESDPLMGILKWVPNRFVEAVGISGEPPVNFITAVIIFILFPLALMMVVVAVSQFRSQVSTGTVAKTFTLLLIPTIASGHLIKALVKMISRLPYWPHALSDPEGMAAARQILDQQLVLSKSASDFLFSGISYVAAVPLLAALAATVYMFFKSPNVKQLDIQVKTSMFLAVLFYWGLLVSTIFLWEFD